MAGITTALCTSAKVEFLSGTHNLATAGNTIKVALFKVGVAGTYSAASTNYSNMTGNSDEVASGGGYTTAGNTLGSQAVTSSGTTAFADFADSSWTSATFSTIGCMIYNSSASNKAISVHDFGGTQTVSAGTLTLVFPAADASNAIIRIA